MKKNSIKGRPMTAFIKWIMVLVNITAVLALGLVKIGSLISPEKLLLPAYASLFLLPLIIINVFFIVFWIFCRKWYLLISLIAIIIFYGTVKSAFPVNLAKPDIDTVSTKIKVLSYNTMNTGMMKKHKKNDPNPVIKYILDTDADVVCLQECAISENSYQFNYDDFERIFKIYPYKHVSFQLNKWSMGIGLVTLSKYPIIEKRNAGYKSIFNLTIYTDIIVGEDTLRIVNNHLESNRITAQDIQMTSKLKDGFDTDELGSVTKYLSQKLSVAYRVRAQQADVVAKLIRESPYKVISCGDYNDVPSSYAYTKVLGNLKDSFKETGNGLGWTFEHSFYRFRIDYIMYDKAFQSANYKRGNLKASDHYPIQTDLYLLKNR
ncbi:MAG TPA: endonuclease/exonuclease/phosphatase family protein [Paludibacteraceae bacterium]|nr:endonuclease/exonuclease/phosphatase family protein [Paludibacteraceae bacterium]HPT43968.1 endonuclease/exonuclease/phosphatase family protein [Paludibacteraceae bacterium]